MHGSASVVARRRSLALAGLGLAAAVALAPSPSSAVERRVTLERVVSPTAGQGVDFENLVGHLEIVPSSGSDLRIAVTVHARADGEAEAERLAGLVSLRVESGSSRIQVHTDYPLDRYDVYHYPTAAHDDDIPAWLAWLGADRSEVRYQGERVSVVGSETHRSVTLWADARLEVPAGTALRAKNMVGRTEAREVSADLALEGGSADLETRACRGTLDLKTGSGDLQVERHAGEIDAETGSGDVVISDLEGGASAHTGSGDVSISRAAGERFFAKTGSGDVRLVEVRGSIEADTGSGDVTGSELVLGARVKADTGSGNVRLAGDFSRVDAATLETGSGDVTLRLAAASNARLVISTGSGDIRVDVPRIAVVRSRSSYFEGRIGEGAATLTIDTGSGDVAVTGP